MPERDLFEYAVIRFVPRVEREEFLNVGVILYCRKQRFLAMRYDVDATRIHAIHQDADLDLLRLALEGFDAVCTGTSASSPIAAQEPADRFRWLTAQRSSVLQVSPVHPGLCIDARETLDKLCANLVSA